MKKLTGLYAVCLGALIWTACPPPVEEDAGTDAGQHDAAQADAVAVDHAVADARRADQWAPDTAVADSHAADQFVADAAATDGAVADVAAPDSAATDQGSADSSIDAAPLDAGRRLVEDKNISSVSGASVASNPWSTPLQYGTAFLKYAVVQLTGATLTAFHMIPLLNDGVARADATLGLPDGTTGLAVVGGYAEPFGTDPTERLWFSYGKPDWTSGIGTAWIVNPVSGTLEIRGPQFDVGALSTTSNFALLMVSDQLIAVDDMAGDVKRFDAYNYATHTPLHVDSLTTAGCTGQPGTMYLGAPFKLADPYFAVSYTGSATDVGKGGFFVFDATATTDASACLVHVALPAAANAGDKVAVSGMAVSSDRSALFVLWDQYGTSFPAERLPSKILKYAFAVAPALSVGSAPVAESGLSALWPSAVYFYADDALIVLESPPAANPPAMDFAASSFVIEQFDVALRSLDTISISVNYAAPFAGAMVDLASGDGIWMGTPGALMAWKVQ